VFVFRDRVVLADADCNAVGGGVLFLTCRCFAQSRLDHASMIENLKTLDPIAPNATTATTTSSNFRFVE
jgi:hypothetical protein